MMFKRKKPPLSEDRKREIENLGRLSRTGANIGFDPQKEDASEVLAAFVRGQREAEKPSWRIEEITADLAPSRTSRLAAEVHAIIQYLDEQASK